MRPVMVDVALLPTYSRPISAVAEMQIKWCKLPQKKPRPKSKIEKDVSLSSVYLKASTKQIMLEKTIESIPMGDRLE